MHFKLPRQTPPFLRFAETKCEKPTVIESPIRTESSKNESNAPLFSSSSETGTTVGFGVGNTVDAGVGSGADGSADACVAAASAVTSVSAAETEGAPVGSGAGSGAGVPHAKSMQQSRSTDTIVQRLRFIKHIITHRLISLKRIKKEPQMRLFPDTVTVL